jgi:leader peptidase (prepilin peptidase)/N-methyltransferase
MTVPFPSSFSMLEHILWVSVFFLLLLIACIDLRETIIPDEATLALLFIGFLLVVLQVPDFGLVTGSLLGHYALLFGFRDNIWFNHLLGAMVALVFFGCLVAITRGRRMGMGDLKLAGALGVVFGWPDVVVILGLAFVFGSCVALWAIVRRAKTMKSAMPFGPFLSLGAIVVFLWGPLILRWYFSLLGA